MTKRSRSSQRWLERQRRDYFARQAQATGNVSRAHYKLEQLDQRLKLLRRGMNVLELGAAPGGWTRYVEERVDPGLVIAVDPLPVTARAGTVVITGHYGEPDVDLAVEQAVDGQPLHLVLSDMAPNISGIRAADQARSMHLVDLATDAALRWLTPGGSLVVKMFQGEGVDEWVRDARRHFARVVLVKPKASRPESRELYGVAREYAGRAENVVDAGPGN